MPLQQSQRHQIRRIYFHFRVDSIGLLTLYRSLLVCWKIVYSRLEHSHLTHNWRGQLPDFFFSLFCCCRCCHIKKKKSTRHIKRRYFAMYKYFAAHFAVSFHLNNLWVVCFGFDNESMYMYSAHDRHMKSDTFLNAKNNTENNYLNEFSSSKRGWNCTI